MQCRVLSSGPGTLAGGQDRSAERAERGRETLRQSRGRSRQRSTAMASVQEKREMKHKLHFSINKMLMHLKAEGDII